MAKYKALYEFPFFNISSLSNEYGFKKQYYLKDVYRTGKATWAFVHRINNSNVDATKIFLPPGLSAFDITLYELGKTADYSVLVDVDQAGAWAPPVIGKTYTLDALRSGPINVMSNAATAFVQPISHNGPSEFEGHWLYVRLSGPGFREFRVTVRLELARFLPWYDSYTKWTASGNPYDPASDGDLPPLPDPVVDPDPDPLPDPVSPEIKVAWSVVKNYMDKHLA